MKNHNHNLIQQLSALSRGEWRFDQYKKDAKGCASCRALWTDLEKAFEKHAVALQKEIASHVEKGMFN